MYSIIANYYDFIFPVDKVKTDFIGSFLPEHNGNILDIGCSTGGFLPFIINKEHSAFSIDLNREMVELAKRRLNSDEQKDRIVVADMLKLDSLFTGVNFDLAFSIGNTVAHLNDIGQLDAFFNQVYCKLNSGGRFVIQVVNYNRFDLGKESIFPLIENEMVIFEREYCWGREDGKVDFNIKLTDKLTGSIIINRELLTPFLPDEILRRLISYGFNIENTFGGFDKSEFISEKSFAFVVVASKSWLEQ